MLRYRLKKGGILTEMLNDNMLKELMLEELEPLGLKPYIHRFTKEMNLIFKFKRKAEAIVYVKEYGIDLLIYKK